jgi:hypothetical protein
VTAKSAIAMASTGLAVSKSAAFVKVPIGSRSSQPGGGGFTGSGWSKLRPGNAALALSPWRRRHSLNVAALLVTSGQVTGILGSGVGSATTTCPVGGNPWLIVGLAGSVHASF